MSNALEVAVFDAIYKGRKFHKPRGTVTFVAEKLWNAHAWNPSYSPLHYVRVRNVKTGKTENVEYYDFKNWIPLDPLPQDKLETKREAAIDSVLGVPWYR